MMLIDKLEVKQHQKIYLFSPVPLIPFIIAATDSINITSQITALVTAVKGSIP